MSRDFKTTPLRMNTPVTGELIIQLVESLFRNEVKEGQQLEKRTHVIDGIVQYTVGISGHISGQNCVVRANGSDIIDPSVAYNTILILPYSWETNEVVTENVKQFRSWMWRWNLREQLRVMLMRSGYMSH